MNELTKRDLMAALAMHALISKAPFKTHDMDDIARFRQIAIGAVTYADQLISALSRLETEVAAATKPQSET